MLDKILIIVAIFAVCIITYFAIKATISRSLQKKQFKYFSNQAKQLEEFKRFRHDYKNRLAGLKALIDNGEYERASQYLSDISQEFDMLTKNTKTYSDNMLIDSALQNLAARCEKANINFDASIIVGNELPLSDVDICTIFYNIADNAYEAVTKKYKGEKFINFITSRRQKWLIVTAENSFDGKLIAGKDGQIKTLKSDSDFHGIGLKSIKRIVEAVPGASVKIETEENIFRISLIFPR